MPHPHQQAQQETPPAMEKRQRNGDDSSSTHASNNDQAQPTTVKTDTGLVDVAVLLAEIDGLRRRLASQAVIEQAKGILMGHYGISSDTAFQILCRWSQDSNTKLRRIAELLIDTTAHSADSRPAPHQIVQQVLPSPRRRDLVV